MAIQLRRGDYTDFDPSQLLDGELAVVLENDPNTVDGTGTYVSYGDSNVKRLLTADESVDVDVATTDTAGIVKPDNTTINVANDGTISGVMLDSDSFTEFNGVTSLNPATDSTLGGVKVDSDNGTVRMDSNDTLYVPAADASTPGVVQPDDETTYIDHNGLLSVVPGLVPASYPYDPEVDGTASAGSSDAYARGDHVHPTDTTRASASDLTSHTSDTTAHVTAAERTAWNAKASTATATTSANGLMSSTDKTKLDGIASGANAYELPLMSSSTRGGAKLGHGLTIEDGALGIGEVTDPTDAGPIVELSAKGWAEQDTTVDPPSPSPSYPQEIRVCRGRNLAFKTIANATVGSNGRVTSTTDYNIMVAKVSQGVTYTARISEANDPSVHAFFATEPSMGSESVDSSRIVGTSTTVFTFTATIDGYVAVRYAHGFTKPQLELGSTAHPYVPYGCVGVDVQGRNLAKPILQAATTKSGVTVTPYDDGSYVINGTATANAIFEIPFDTPLPAGTYTISANNSVAANVSSETYVRASIQSSAVGASRAPLNVANSTKTFTVSEPLYLWAIRVGNGDTLTNYRIYPMLERNDHATAYEPYTNYSIPIPLPSRGWVASLPDGTADTLALDGAGGFTWELNTGEVVLDGSETWNVSGSGTSSWFLVTQSSVYDWKAGLALYSTHYIPNTIISTTDGVGMQLFRTSNAVDGYLRIRESQEISVEDFKARLAQNPVTVLYPTTTPTTESGYVSDMPTVPVHAAISSADLVDLTVRCCADEGAAEIASAWGRRYEERIAALEEIVANLI